MKDNKKTSMPDKKKVINIIKNNSKFSFSEVTSDKWYELKDDPIHQSMMENSLGIPIIHPMYIETNEIQNKMHEYTKITKFLSKYMEYYANKYNLNVDNLMCDFINYGKTELVYVLKNGKENLATLLVKQPAVEFGKVWQETANLKTLKHRDDNVIAPIDYFSYGDQELYMTPYIKQARCIASDNSWGMYIPEPFYRFESFTTKQEKVVNTCMIAKLVSLYDFKNNQGVSNCKLGGGDFMLPKGWENSEPTIENTLKNLYLIAARDYINCSFEEYLNILRKEFSIPTIKLDQSTLHINLRGRVAMNPSDIENGISLGKQLIKNKGYLMRN